MSMDAARESNKGGENKCTKEERGKADALKKRREASVEKVCQRQQAMAAIMLVVLVVECWLLSVGC